jgi:hypothetical protein
MPQAAIAKGHLTTDQIGSSLTEKVHKLCATVSAIPESYTRFFDAKFVISNYPQVVAF